VIKKRYDFQHRILRAGVFPNLISAFIIFIYSACIISMPVMMMLPAFGIVIIIVATAQCIFAPLSNIPVSRGLSLSLEYWKTEQTSEMERTRLLQRVMSYPMRKGLETLVYFMSCAGILAWGYSYVLHLDPFINLVSVTACLFGAYISMLLALSFSEKLCSEYAQQIVAQGISPGIVTKYHFFGLSLRLLFILYIVIPALYSGLIAFLVVKMGYIFLVTHAGGSVVCLTLSASELHGYFVKSRPDVSVQLIRMTFVSVTNIVVVSVLSVLYFQRIVMYTKQMREALSAMNTSNVTHADLVPTDLSTDMSYSMYLINRTILLFRSILEETESIGKRVVDSVQNLVVISRETASTSLEQSAGVKEILATMEETDRLAHDIEKKIGEVHTVASKTTEDVEYGSKTVRENLQKMREITEANYTTITGIQGLCEKINGIWEIVTVINGVADQTKIIAFNAELEAVDSGNAESNFRNVASEIRALANSTMESTKKIKNQIQEIQISSDTLIVTARNCMEKIEAGRKMTQTFETNFNDISRSAELTAVSSEEISRSIREQTAAFEQIVVTLRQISASVENFSSATQIISGTATNLKQSADRLGALTGAAK
jgi:methyl-accepting chemotaxis protein